MILKQIFRGLITLILFSLLAGCATKQMASPSPTMAVSPTLTQTVPTPTESKPITSPEWGGVESSLSKAMLVGQENGKCEWEVLGWMNQEVYVWAFCLGGPGEHSIGMSAPAVLHIQQDHSIQNIDLPDDGSGYPISIRRLFPPSIQERVFKHDFDVEAAKTHLATRWKDPSLAPAIYIQTGDALPMQGKPEIPSISANSVDRLDLMLTLGEGNVLGLEFLQDGQLVAYGENGIDLIDVNKFRASRPFQDILSDRDGWLSLDGSLLFSWKEGSVQVVRVQDGSVLQGIATDFPGGTVVGAKILPDGNTLAVEVRPPGDEIYSHQVELYSLDDGALINAWDMRGAGMLFSPDGKTMASGSMGGEMIWSIPDGQLLHSFNAVRFDSAFSPDSQLLAISDFGLVRVLQLTEEKEIFHLSEDIGPVSGLVFSPEGDKLLTWSRDSDPAHLWLTSDGSEEIEIPLQGVRAGVFSPDGTMVALAGSGGIYFYSVLNGELINSLDNYLPEVAELSFSSDSSQDESTHLAVIYGWNTDYTILVNWSIPEGKRQFLNDAYAGISLEYLDYQLGIAVGTQDGTVEIINPADGSLLGTYTGFSAQVQDLAQSVWGELAASSMEEVLILGLPAKNGEVRTKLDIPGGWVDSLSWQSFLVAANNEGLKVFDEMKNVVASLSAGDEGWETQLVVPLAGNQILAGKNQTIYRWQTSNWEALPKWFLPSAVTAMSISPDGTLLAVGLSDGQVQLLDSEDGSLLGSLPGHQYMVSALDFSMDGRFLATGGPDGIIKVWGVK